MSTQVTLELPEELARRAHAAAAQAERPVEEVLVEWIDRAAPEAPVESLTDEQVLALCDGQLDPARQEELSNLLGRNQEGALPTAEHRRLEELLGTYRRGWVRKARALKEAVAHGLRPRLDANGADAHPR